MKEALRETCMNIKVGGECGIQHKAVTRTSFIFRILFCSRVETYNTYTSLQLLLKPIMPTCHWNWNQIAGTFCNCWHVTNLAWFRQECEWSQTICLLICAGPAAFLFSKHRDTQLFFVGVCLPQPVPSIDLVEKTNKHWSLSLVYILPMVLY